MIAPAIPGRVSRLLPMLGSDKPNEIASTCRAILHDLETVGLDFHGVEIVPKDVKTSLTTRSASASAPMPNFFDMARACRDVYGDQLNDWEFCFVGDMCRRASPTHKEMMRLSSIFASVQRRAVT